MLLCWVVVLLVMDCLYDNKKRCFTLNILNYGVGGKKNILSPLEVQSLPRLAGRRRDKRRSLTGDGTIPAVFTAAVTDSN